MRDIRRNPRSNVCACAAGDGAICCKIRKLSHNRDNLVPRDRDPFGQQRGSRPRPDFQRMTIWTPGDEVVINLVPRVHVTFGQHQDTELWNNQFPETKILGLPASRRMRGFVYMASRDKVDEDTYPKGIQYALEKLGKSKFGFESTTVSKALGASLLIIPELRVLVLTKRHVGSGKEIGL